MPGLDLSDRHRTVADPVLDAPGSTPRVLGLVGNPRPESRTAALARSVVEELDGALWGRVPDADQLLDLATLTESLGPQLGAAVPERWAQPLARLHAARLLVVATPVYKASYPGLLKSFLDQVDAGALRGRVAIPVLTPADPGHGQVAELHLRPLLAELGASLPTASLIVTADRLDRPRDAVADWLAPALELLRPLLGSAAAAVTA